MAVIYSQEADPVCKETLFLAIPKQSKLKLFLQTQKRVQNIY